MVFHVREWLIYSSVYSSAEPRYYLSVNFTFMQGAGDSILAYCSVYLNCTTMLALIFRWFKFTLKPPYSIAHDKL